MSGLQAGADDLASGHGLLKAEVFRGGVDVTDAGACVWIAVLHSTGAVVRVKSLVWYLSWTHLPCWQTILRFSSA